MKLKYSLLLLVTLLCLALAASSKNSPTFEELVERSERRLVKRDIFDDIRNAFNKVGSSFNNVIQQIQNFTAEKYAEFKESLSNLGKDEMEKTLDKLKEHYDTLSDKTSAEALRIKETMTELEKDIAAAGSSAVKGSLLTATALLIVSMFFLH